LDGEFGWRGGGGGRWSYERLWLGGLLFAGGFESGALGGAT
jgi:hypothetical protein